MRKTLPLIFLVCAVLGAAVIGYMASSFGLSQLKADLAKNQKEIAAVKQQNTDLLNNQTRLKEGFEAKALAFEKAQKQAKQKAEQLRKAVIEKSANSLKAETAKSEELEAELASTSEELTQLKQKMIATEVAHRRQMVAQAEDSKDKMITELEKQLEAQKQKLAKDSEQAKAALERQMAELSDAQNSQRLDFETRLTKLGDEHTAVLKTAKEEKDYLYAELDRYAQTTNDMFKQLGQDVGGLDILLTPEFKSNFAEFLGELNLNSN